MDEFLSFFTNNMIIFLIIAIILYIIYCIFIRSFYKLVYEKKTVLAWIPIYNIYLLGTLVINELIGFIVAICSLLFIRFQITFSNFSINYGVLDMLPEESRKVIYTKIAPIFFVILLLILIIGIIKYILLNKEHKNKLKYASKINKQNISNNNEIKDDFLFNNNIISTEDELILPVKKNNN